MNYSGVSNALESDHPLLFHPAVAESSFSILSDQLYLRPLFWISEVVAYKGFDCNYNQLYRWLYLGDVCRYA